MPSGNKYIIHQKCLEYIKISNSNNTFIGNYKDFSEIYGKNSKYKYSDIIIINNNVITSFEIKCHKNKSDWGEISWDQAERLLSDEKIIIVEYEKNNIIIFDGPLFVSEKCYFTKNGRIHYNYIKLNKRVNTHTVTLKKILDCRKMFN